MIAGYIYSGKGLHQFKTLYKLSCKITFPEFFVLHQLHMEGDSCLHAFYHILA